MATKTIRDSIDAISNLHTSLKNLVDAALALDEPQNLHLVRTSARIIAHAREAERVLIDTEEFVHPQIAEGITAATAADAGRALYGWLVCNMSFNDKFPGTVFEQRAAAFLEQQLKRFPDDALVRQRAREGFMAADQERFDNDAALGRDERELEEVLRSRFEDTKPNSDCSLEAWAHSAIVRLGGTIEELEEKQPVLFKELLEATYEDHGVVTLEFISDTAAQQFMADCNPGVEYEALTRDQQTDVDNNRTLRNAEANERLKRPYFKYSVGMVMKARSGFPTLPIRNRLVDESDHEWYMLGDGLERTTVSELTLDSEWVHVDASPRNHKWRYGIGHHFDRLERSLCEDRWLAITSRVTLESGALGYIATSDTRNAFVISESQLRDNYVAR